MTAVCCTPSCFRDSVSGYCIYPDIRLCIPQGLESRIICVLAERGSLRYSILRKEMTMINVCVKGTSKDLVAEMKPDRAVAHSSYCDVPEDQGGSNSYMRPGETLLSALGACINITARKYLNEDRERIIEETRSCPVCNILRSNIVLDI